MAAKMSAHTALVRAEETARSLDETARQVYFTARVPGMTNPALNTIDVTTGEVGIPVELTGNPSLHIEELRFFHGTLYAASRYGRLLTIDPTTGVTTLVNTAAYANAMEVFE